MNPNKFELWIASELDQLRPLSVKLAHLCVWECKICLLSVDHTKVSHPLLYVFTEQQIKHGLTSEENAAVLRILLKHERRFSICLSHQN